MAEIQRVSASNHDVIAAFADGERVSPDGLNRALADERGREYLIDLLVLRGLVQAAGPEMDVEIVSAPPRRRAHTWLGLAAAIVASVIGGYAAGRVTAPAAARLPVVTAVAETVTVPPRPAAAAPQPTRVIHLEPGVDWKENSGG